MPERNLPKEPITSGPFKGFLLAAYKSITNTIRSHRITRAVLISYLIVLVIIPPVIILTAFLVKPSQTARFFSFRVAGDLNPQVLGASTIAGDLNPQVLGDNTVDQSTKEGSVLGEYVSALLEPQAVAAIKALRALNPEIVSDVILPAEEPKIQMFEPNYSIAGPPGPQGPPGPSGTACVLSREASDPVGVNGDMYYNTTMNKFRCYEGNVWKNCICP